MWRKITSSLNGFVKGRREKPTVTIDDPPGKTRFELSNMKTAEEEPNANCGSIGQEDVPLDFSMLGDGQEDDTNLIDGAEYVEIPAIVRRIVSFEDNPELPSLTFRYFVLSFIFVVPGAFLSQMVTYRTTGAPYSLFFVQIAAHYAGIWLARILPAKVIELPLIGFRLTLNPAPWSIKEHVLIVLTAAAGARATVASIPLTVAEIFYDDVTPAAVALVYMFAIVMAGYAVAAIARSFLLYDPWYIWPDALMHTALFEMFRKSSTSPTAKKQKRVFGYGILGMTLWQFIPEFVFPFLISLSIICWSAPHNAVANFIGAGLGGMGFLTFTLDWSLIGSGIMIMPWWTQVVAFCGFAINTWVLIPWAKFGNLSPYKHGLMSNRLFNSTGSLYPVGKLLGRNFEFNETLYEEYGPIYIGAQQAWNTLFAYASATSGLIWVALFGYPRLRRAYEHFVAKRRAAKSAQPAEEEFKDKLNKLYRIYPDIPIWWSVALFMASFVPMMAILGTGYMFMPLWTYFVAIITGALLVLPFGWLYAVSNFQMTVGSLNEMIYGFLIHSQAGIRHPAGASAYGAVAGDVWYRAQTMLQDQKIGFYMHIAPREVFFSQLFGLLLGTPVNYGVIRWVLSTKRGYLTGEEIDPTHQWTGQEYVGYNTIGVLYVIVGPARLFKHHLYHILPYGYLIGACAPLLVWLLHRRFPRAGFEYWNTTILLSSLSSFVGNISAGALSQLLCGYVCMYWALRYRPQLWARYNYIIGAAFDTGFNFTMVIIFLITGVGQQISMPNWWGNNEESVERCFAL